MKTTTRVNSIKSLVFLSIATWFSLATPAHGAVGVTITPSVISNNYNGYITVQVTGLHTGEQVRIEKYLDANTNGVIDGGDWLMQRFKVTDGLANMAFGGVINTSMPFDTPHGIGTEDGTINAKMEFASSIFVQDFVGSYLFAVSSPTGGFATVTNSFTIASAITNQCITGIVQCGGTNIPYAGVLLVSGGSGGKGGPIAGTVANSSGTYTIKTAPGSYQLWAFKSNYVFNVGAAPSVTLNPGATITTNLSLIPATQSFSGQIIDAGTSKGLPGLLLYAMNADNSLFVGSYADTNGNFSVPVTADQWSIGVDDSQLAFYGYIGPNKNSGGADTTTGNVSGITIALPKATALVYGRVTDSSGNPMVGIDIEAQDNGGIYQADFFTDTNGNYVAGLLGGIAWQVQVNSDAAPANYIFSQPDFNQNGGTAISASTATLVNFSGLLVTNTLSGTLKDNNNNPISNVWVYAGTTLSGTNYNQGAATDGGGHYSFAVGNATWTINVNTGGGDGSLPSQYMAPPNQDVTVSNTNATLNLVALLATNTISGHVSFNGSSVTNLGVGGSATISGAVYNVYADTDGSGNYALNVGNGAWTVVLNADNNGDCLNSILGFGNYQNPASQIIGITNHNGTANFVVPPYSLLITTTTLPNATNNVSYDQFVQGSSSSGTLNWSLNDPPDFPSGLNFNTGNGEISGSPNTSVGTYTFTIQVNDGYGHTTNQILSLYIAAAPPPLQITTFSLPNGTNGAAYNATLLATGGFTPYSWTILSGSLPTGLSLATNGIISGTCSSVGSSNFTVQVTDANSQSTSQPLSITVVVAVGQWRERAFMPVPVGWHGAAVISNKIYVVGGSYNNSYNSSEYLYWNNNTSLYVYDPVAGTWSSRTPMPDACTQPGPVVAALNGKLYVYGWFATGANKLLVYDPSSNTWSNRTASSMSHSGPCGGVISNKLYVAGYTGVPWNNFEVYDPQADAWTTLSGMNQPRSDAAAVVVSNLLYVIGGNVLGTDETTVEVYDPNNDSAGWFSCASMNYPRSYLAATACNGQIYAIGGSYYGGDDNAQQMEIYNPQNDSWTVAPPLPTPRTSLAAAAISNSVYVIGGYNQGANWALLPTLEVYGTTPPDTVQTIFFQSDTNTLAASVGSLTLNRFNWLDSGVTTGVTFQAAKSGVSSGSATVNTPFGAWNNTSVITIPPGTGQNGFFKISFVLPPSFGDAQLSLCANAALYARAFLNGNPLTPSMNNQTQCIAYAGNTFAVATNQAWFAPGTNVLVIANARSNGIIDANGSGVAFYGLVTYQPLPVIQTPVRPTAGQFGFWIGGVTNETYAIEISSNLLASSWTTLFSTNSTGVPFLFVDTIGASKTRFYRVTVH